MPPADTLRVGLDVTQAVKTRGRGIARYIRQVLPPLAEQQLELTLHIRGHRWFRRSLISDLVPGARRSWLPLTSRLNTSRIDLFHSFGNHLPARANVPLSFTVHDIRALDRPAGYEGKERLQQNITRAAGIICLTEYGRQRLVQHYPELEEKCLAVVPHGVDHSQFCPKDAKEATNAARKHGVEPPFLLQLGSWFPHKNLELSIRAFARSHACSSGFRLVFIGGNASTEHRTVLKDIALQERVSNAIDWVEHVPTSDLAPLLASSGCLLQPSRYEGFALPILEAMATGVPGVVSDSSCLPEVSGGIWPIAHQDDAEAFAQGIDLMTLDDTARENAIRAGIRYASNFTWDKSAQKTSDFFHQMLIA